MAIADGALFGYDSLEDVRRQKIPARKDEVILRFRDSALDRPILRKCTKTGGVTDDPMPKSSFTSIFKSTLTNTGYFCGLSIHAIRRQLGKGVDSKFTWFMPLCPRCRGFCISVILFGAVNFIVGVPLLT